MKSKYIYWLTILIAIWFATLTYYTTTYFVWRFRDDNIIDYIYWYAIMAPLGAQSLEYIYLIGFGIANIIKYLYHKSIDTANVLLVALAAINVVLNPTSIISHTSNITKDLLVASIQLSVSKLSIILGVCVIFAIICYLLYRLSKAAYKAIRLISKLKISIKLSSEFFGALIFVIGLIVIGIIIYYRIYNIANI